jgi:diguanylate cyclase (GGDEF)-like protein
MKRAPRATLLALQLALAASATLTVVPLRALPAPVAAPQGDRLAAARAQDALSARIDKAVRLATEDHAGAVAALDRIEASLTQPLAGETRRQLARARLQALVEALRPDALELALSELDWPSTGAAGIDRALLEAQLEELRGRGSAAAEKARLALEQLREHCPPPSTLRANVLQLESAPPVGADSGRDGASADGLAAHPHCDYRSMWTALRIIEREALSEGLLTQARAGTLERLELARAAGDLYRTALAWSGLAMLAARENEAAAVIARYQARAREAAERSGEPSLRIRILINEAANAAFAGDAETAMRRNRSALALSRSAGLKRLQALLLNNIADAHLRLGQPRQALSAVREGLPLARASGLRSVELALNSNLGLAQIALGRVEQGRQQLAQLERLREAEGGAGERVAMLREYGEALATAGDAEGALALYHRERELAKQISEQNLAAALREIQQSFDAEVRQRDMALLRDQVATRDAELATQDLTLRIGLLLLAVLAVLLLIAGLLYRNLRGRERLLSARRERLRQESELDPLTGLGNRRAMTARMLAQAAAGGPSGALLLLDVDHFKAINDRFGHAVGDAVLVEVGRRLAASLRRQDAVVRWGGEEFLIHADGVGGEQAMLLARRTLEKLASEPIDTVAGQVRVGASIGLCLLRLNPNAPDLPWEQALRLADLALYAAKSRGRGRAVGLLAITAVEPDALLRVEEDFEAAERSGLLQVQSVVLANA